MPWASMSQLGLQKNERRRGSWAGIFFSRQKGNIDEKYGVMQYVCGVLQKYSLIDGQIAAKKLLPKPMTREWKLYHGWLARLNEDVIDHSFDRHEK